MMTWSSSLHLHHHTVDIFLVPLQSINLFHVAYIKDFDERVSGGCQ